MFTPGSAKMSYQTLRAMSLPSSAITPSAQILGDISTYTADAEGDTEMLEPKVATIPPPKGKAPAIPPAIPAALEEFSAILAAIDEESDSSPLLSLLRKAACS